MGYACKITNQQGLYYITFTVKDWIDIFTRNEYRPIVKKRIIFFSEDMGKHFSNQSTVMKSF